MYSRQIIFRMYQKISSFLKLLCCKICSISTNYYAVQGMLTYNGSFASGQFHGKGEWFSPSGHHYTVLQASFWYTNHRVHQSGPRLYTPACVAVYLIYFVIGNRSYTPCSEPSCTVGCITFGFFRIKKIVKVPMVPQSKTWNLKFFLYFFGRVPMLRWGSESTYLSKV